jgi:DnaK suppressor protein
MTDIQLKPFRTILENRQSELQNGTRERDSLTVEATPDELDRIQQASERDFAVSGLQRNETQLREVQAALRRMKAGTFGMCPNCEENISLKRLTALPWATLCIVCQEAEDMGQEISRTELDSQFDMAA